MTIHMLIKKYALYAAWLQALVAMVGSLILSQVMHFPPCDLCWYQRIFMYPLTFVLGVGIIRKDKNVVFYSLPLSIIGLLIASYHILLQEGLIPQSLQPCGVSVVTCGAKYLTLFGFVTIPILSFVAFSIITGLLLLHKQSMRLRLKQSLPLRGKKKHNIK